MVFYGIPSKGRPQNVTRYADDVTWFVPPSEVEDYKNAGAVNVIADVGWPGVRNQILEVGFRRAEHVVMLDDDLKKTWMLNKDGKTKNPCTYQDITREIVARMTESRSFLGGVPPVANPFYMSHAIKPNLFIIGSFCVTKKTDVRFDESYPLKEDYDYTMRHIEKYGKVCRVDYCGAEFEHYTNAGGCVDDRKMSIEEECVKRLVSKWSPHIKKHPRREGEVLLRAKLIK